MTKWPAHLEERARIFELTGADGEPLKGPTRLPLLIEGETYVEFDPRSFRVLGSGLLPKEDATCRSTDLQTDSKAKPSKRNGANDAQSAAT